MQNEKEILADTSVEGEVLRTIVTHLRSPTLVSDLLQANSAAEIQLKQAMINLRKDYVLETVGTSKELLQEFCVIDIVDTCLIRKSKSH